MHGTHHIHSPRPSTARCWGYALKWAAERDAPPASIKRRRLVMPGTK
jgi:hypothetical protein